jgi:hypothetical protein
VKMPDKGSAKISAELKSEGTSRQLEYGRGKFNEFGRDLRSSEKLRSVE